MASVLLPPRVSFMGTPSSPDPTPLRLLAFSVAEAALQPDPNSPSLNFEPCASAALQGDWVGPWSQPHCSNVQPVKAAVGRNLWNVVASAKERRVKVNTSSHLAEPLPPSPPISPASYNFVLPDNSPLAASIAASPVKSRHTFADLPPLSFDSPSRPRAFPAFTRSAEPSPTKSTFSALDQSRPPPEFVPRLIDSPPRVRKSVDIGKGSPSALLRTQARGPSPVAGRSPSRHNTRLPSLAQIQAKMQKVGHRRGSSVGCIELPAPIPLMPRLRASHRTESEDSLEFIQTPPDELPPAIQPRIVFAAAHDPRPPTPPSPLGETKGPRLAPFLRQRTSGRLAGARARPVSMPPMREPFNIFNFPGSGPDGPVFTVTPPSLETQPRPAAQPVLPNKDAAIVLNTPPRRASASATAYSPTSPTGSVSSMLSSTASPTLSVPMITCTPAPGRLVRNGVEQDSDEEEGDCTTGRRPAPPLNSYTLHPGWVSRPVKSDVCHK